MNTKLSLLSEQVPGITISVGLAELSEWHREIIASTKRELEQTIAEQKADTYVSPKKAAEIFDVDPSTLHRWKHKGYLIPVEVGGKRRYRMSDINRILEGGRK